MIYDHRKPRPLLRRRPRKTPSGRSKKTQSGQRGPRAVPKSETGLAVDACRRWYALKTRFGQLTGLLCLQGNGRGQSRRGSTEESRAGCASRSRGSVAAVEAQRRRRKDSAEKVNRPRHARSVAARRPSGPRIEPQGSDAKRVWHRQCARRLVAGEPSAQHDGRPTPRAQIQGCLRGL